MKTRGFIALRDNVPLPKRQTIYSAGYDIHADITDPVVINPGRMVVIPTGLTYYCLPDEYLTLVPRSGLGFHYQVTLQNSPATLDADYPPNEFKVLLRNEGERAFTVHQNDRIAQAIFHKYLTVDDDSPVERTRESGFGHTNK